MKRLHLFEFEDQSWFPDIIRNYMTDFLRHVTIQMGLEKPIIALIRDTFKQTGETKILDLCSGSGGLLVAIQDVIDKQHAEKIPVHFTDKYPNHSALASLCEKSPTIRTFEKESVDAISVPGSLAGLRTFFSAFHHFRPDAAKNILRNIVESKSSIAIFEVSRRSLVGLIPMLLSPLAVLLYTPFIKPFKWSRLLLTYVIPAVPFFVMWDGIVSALRTYSVQEMKDLVKTINAQKYQWSIGRCSAPLGHKVSYLIGYPKD